MVAQFLASIGKGDVPEIFGIENFLTDSTTCCRTPVVLLDTSAVIGLEQNYQSLTGRQGEAWKIIKYLSRDYDEEGRNYIVLITENIFRELTAKKKNREISDRTYDCLMQLYQGSAPFIDGKRRGGSSMTSIEAKVVQAYENGMASQNKKAKERKLNGDYISAPDVEVLATGVALERSGTCKVVVCSADAHFRITANELKIGPYFGNLKRNKDNLPHFHYLHTRN